MNIADWFAAVMDAARSRQQGLEAAYQHLENAGLISKVTVHRYVCKRGCGPLATLVSIDGAIILRTRDYKPSRGLNQARSVAAARAKNTLDGDRHWPAYTLDLARNAGHPEGNIEVVCKHGPKRIMYRDALGHAAGATPGHPGKPSLL